ncbi:MAG TPA: hypothetical protein VH442_06840 [Micromonosporaceae bacterium]|jgi:hypothetical protein
MSSLVLLGSDRPIPGERGRLWRAVDGAPAFRRLVLVDDDTQLDLAEFGPDVTVWVGRQIDSLEPSGDISDATVLLAVGQEPEPGFEEPFNSWMDEEHVPGLGGVPGTLSAHRYHSANAVPAYFAVYHLRNRDVNTTPEWKRASQTARSEAMRPHSRHRVRGLYVAA